MQKKITKKNGKIFGVCEGMGDYFNIDPTIIRILFLVGVICFGSGLLLYIILALAMPKENN